MDEDVTARVKFWACFGSLVLVVGVVGLYAYPRYNVWRAGLAGEARLREAESTKRILIETAKAEVESAKLRSEAIALVGAAAAKYPEYRQQEFIGAFAEALREGNVDQIMYVPTEANVPITESGRHALERLSR